MRIGDRHKGAAKLHIGAANVLPRHMWAHVRQLTKLRVDPDQRGQGDGTALLNDVCGEADRERVALMLSVDEVPDREKLVNWYRRAGFETWFAVPTKTVMIRRARDS